MRRPMQTESTYLVKSKYTVDTRDYEDHTFNGIMFDLDCSDTLPVKDIVIESIWVRGRLGSMSVYITPETHANKEENSEEWKQIHTGQYSASFEELKEMKLEHPISLKPGQSIGIYVHSADRGDEGIVYNNQRGVFTHVDRHLKIMPGLAHLSSIPFDGIGRGWVSTQVIAKSRVMGLTFYLPFCPFSHFCIPVLSVGGLASPP